MCVCVCVRALGLVVGVALVFVLDPRWRRDSSTSARLIVLCMHTHTPHTPMDHQVLSGAWMTFMVAKASDIIKCVLYIVGFPLNGLCAHCLYTRSMTL